MKKYFVTFGVFAVMFTVFAVGAFAENPVESIIQGAGQTIQTETIWNKVESQMTPQLMSMFTTLFVDIVMKVLPYGISAAVIKKVLRMIPSTVKGFIG